MQLETQTSAQFLFQKLNVDNSCQKTRKSRNYIFDALSNFTVFLFLAPVILARIVDIPIAKYRNIIVDYLGSKGCRLNPRGISTSVCNKYWKNCAN